MVSVLPKLASLPCRPAGLPEVLCWMSLRSSFWALTTNDIGLLGFFLFSLLRLFPPLVMRLVAALDMNVDGYKCYRFLDVVGYASGIGRRQHARAQIVGALASQA